MCQVGTKTHVVLDDQQRVVVFGGVGIDDAGILVEDIALDIILGGQIVIVDVGIRGGRRTVTGDDRRVRHVRGLRAAAPAAIGASAPAGGDAAGVAGGGGDRAAAGPTGAVSVFVRERDDLTAGDDDGAVPAAAAGQKGDAAGAAGGRAVVRGDGPVGQHRAVGHGPVQLDAVLGPGVGVGAAGLVGGLVLGEGVGGAVAIAQQGGLLLLVGENDLVLPPYIGKGEGGLERIADFGQNQRAAQDAQPQSRRLHRYFSLAGQFSVFRTLGHLNILSAFEKGAYTAAELVIIHGLGEVTVHACLHRLALVL